uniref:Uncharacterized protein n=1 Tax=viral metagenome TaxID=1070528 RepID=A0A6M3LM15_9ZZZZ
MPNETNRVMYRLKSEPDSGHAVDFKSIIVKDGIVTIETYLETLEFKYEEINEHIAIWPRAWPGSNPLDLENGT